MINKDKVMASLCYSLVALSCVAAASAIGSFFRYLEFPETNMVVVYILAVILSARYTKGYFYGILATVMATCAFNYFFTEPYFTLSVNDPSYFVTFAIMTLTSVITSALTSKVTQSARHAQEKEAAASALYQLTNRLTDASDMSDIASIAVQTISDIMNCRAACLCFDENGEPEASYIQQKKPDEQIRRELDENFDRKDMKQRMQTLPSAYAVGKEFCDWPISGKDTLLGVLRIPKENAKKMIEAQLRLLRSMIESTAMAMDRLRSAQERMKSREEIVQERYRANLLRAISHDLRTPLSGIMGTSEILISMTDKTDERYALAEGIYHDADWLHSLVENILNLTRLQDGRLMIKKQMEAIEEVIGAALMAIGKRMPECDISIQIPEKPLFVPMDAKLIAQVLINLLDNAVKHSARHDEIIIEVTEDTEKKQAICSVTDSGTGIAAIDFPHIFQIFYTSHCQAADAKRGVGLGLSICESIIQAHGGSIHAQNRDNGRGATFTFALPMEDMSE